MTSATETFRHSMLIGLTQDLYAAGWDQDCKMWFVLGEPGDEYMEYVGAFSMEPEHWLMHRAEEGSLREHVQGVVVCFESWTYPRALNKALKNNRVSDAYRKLIPPGEHPDGSDVRTLVFTARDGMVLRTVQYGDNADKVHVQGMEPSPEPGIVTGDRMVDFMRVMLGIAEMPLDQSVAAIVATRPDLQELMMTARVENWDPARSGGELFLHMDQSVQQSMLATMPDDVRAYLVEKGYDFTLLAKPTFEEVTDDPS